MRNLLLSLLLLLSLALPAKEALLTVPSSDRPPEADWKLEGGPVNMSLAPWPNGESGLTVKFTYPVSSGGWPSGKFQVPQEMRDWSNARTLVIELYSEIPKRVGVEVATIPELPRRFSFSSQALTECQQGRNTLRLPLEQMVGFDLSQVKYIDIFTGDVAQEYSIYVGEIRLELRDPEEEAARNKAAMQEARAGLEWRKALLKGKLPPSAAQLQALESFLPETPETRQVERFQKECGKVFPRLDALYFRRAAEAEGGVALRWCMPEEKVLREDYAFLHAPLREYALEAARGEGESAQLVAYAPTPLQGIQAEWETLPAMEDGTQIPREALMLAPVGYVKTQDPPYQTEHIGYWPDPILEYLQSPIPLEAKTYQSWWLDVQVPQDQKPGLYRGAVKFTYDGGRSQVLPFTIRVHSFTLPKGVPYFSPVQFGTLANYPADPEARRAYWREIALLLIRHRLQPDQIYRGVDRPHMLEDSQWLLEQGAGFFNMGYINDSPSPEILETLAKNYRECQRLGIADKAYIYTFDEAPAQRFPLIRDTLKKIREAAPGLPIYTTLYDGTFGKTSGMEELVDGWIPLTVSYGRNAAYAAEARARGKKVGWYVCCTPLLPYANFLLEHPATANRLLMGFMARKYRPDGFLYYGSCLWSTWTKTDKGYVRDKEIPIPVTGGPLLQEPWVANSFRNFSGDGRLLYPAADGPIPTTRLKSIRDGMEDWMYMDLLEKAVAAPEGMSREWLTEATRELKVEPSLVQDLIHWTRDPQLLQEKRLRLARLLDEYAGKPSPANE